MIMEQLDKIMDLMRYAIDAGQTIKITIDELIVKADQTTINGLEITTEA
jgi:hypothetical protein